MSKKTRKELKAEINAYKIALNASLAINEGMLDIIEARTKTLRSIYKYGPRNVSEQFGLDEMFDQDDN